MLGAVTGLPAVDADSMGRAFPEGQMTSFAIAGLPMLTTVLSDVRGIEVIVKRAANARWMERISRKACAEMGSIAAACRAPRTGREIKDHGILYSTSKAIRIGRIVGEARRRRDDAHCRPHRGRERRAAVQKARPKRRSGWQGRAGLNR